MKATVDANILFAALIRDSATRRLWLHAGLELFAPEFIIAEFLKHRPLVIRKSGADSDELDRLLQQMLKKVIRVPDAELKLFLSAAQSLCKDPDDTRYLACALTKDTIIWSQDRHFKEQTRIKVRTTAELMAQIGGLGK